MLKVWFDRSFAVVFALLCAGAANWPFWMVPRANVELMTQSVAIIGSVIAGVMVLTRYVPMFDVIYRFVEGPFACAERRRAFIQIPSGYQGYYLLYSTAIMLFSVSCFSGLSLIVEYYI